MKRAVLVATSLALFACDDSGTAPSSGPIISDSAGIRIVQTPPGDLLYAALAEEPSLSIGLLSGPEEFLFGRIASARRDAAGNLIVADRQALEIRIFCRASRSNAGTCSPTTAHTSAAWTSPHRSGSRKSAAARPSASPPTTSASSASSCAT